MAVSLYITFFILAHLVLLHSVSAQEENNIQTSCPKSFHCRELKPMSFPLSNSTYSQCGLCTVTCESHPRIQLGINEGPWYEVIEIKSQADSIQVKIHDQALKRRLHDGSCDAFNNLSFPNSPSISFTISHNLTLFKCNKSLELSTHTDDNFNDFYNYTICKDHNLYYQHPDGQHFTPPADLLSHCSVIQLPMKSPDMYHDDASHPFNVLADTFFLELHVSEDCRKCHRRGRQCQNVNQKFYCATKENLISHVFADCEKCRQKGGKEGGTNFGLILGTVIPGGFILLICLLIFIMHRRKKWKYVSSYFLSKNSSSDPSSKADVQCSIVFFGVPVFSYSELEEATNNFDPCKELGDGGFGTVYHGKLQDGRDVAVKRLYEHNYNRVTQFMNEVEILTRLRHQNLVSLYGCTSRRSRELLLVYEYIPNGTVADHLHGDQARDGLLTWPIRMNIAIETAGALAYLHASDIIHRDVKTNNILLDNNFGVKVADFGLSRLFPTDVSHVSTAPQGTPGYVDPEYRQCYQVTDKSDVYSFGVVLIELISSMPAVDINRHRHEINLASLAINKIQNRAINELIDPSLGFESDSSIERMTTSVADVAFRCLQLEKEMRPTMDEVLKALKEIQEYEDETIGEEIDNVGASASARPPLAEGNDVVLLKNINMPPSLDSLPNLFPVCKVSFHSA